jgi:hypothetical protein
MKPTPNKKYKEKLESAIKEDISWALNKDKNSNPTQQQ